MLLRPAAIFSLLTFIAALAAHGADAARIWSTKVQPLLDAQCVKCHGPIEQKNGLELDTVQAALKGSEDGPVLVPGKPEESSLYLALTAKADPHMPPKKQLSDAERDAVREWIAALTPMQVKPGGEKPAPRSFGSIPEAIDTLVAEGWQQRGVTPAASVDERTWCRRVYLDLAGRIPTPAEAEAFLHAPAATRRAELVDRLLAAPEYAVHLRELWDVFLMGRGKPGDSDARRTGGWWKFLETAFRENRPWNETVRAVLIARADQPQNAGSARFLYERRNDYQRIAEAVAPIVYGTKVDCAQCHDHPLAREIKQAHYWGLVTVYNRSKNVEGSPEVAESAIGGFNNFTNLKKESQPALISLLSGGEVAEAWPAGGQKEQDSDDKYVDPKAKARVPKYSRRAAFAEAVTTNNPLLARAFVNRMWAVLLGRGLVHPADEMNGRNAPSHPELLEWLAQDFATHQYDVRRFIRGVVLSEVYALGHSDAAPDSFAGAPERPLQAEQIARSWRVVAGLPPQDQHLNHVVVEALPDVLPRDYSATFQQAQFLTSSPELAGLLVPAPGNTAERLAALPDAPARVQAIFSAAYGRAPDAEELAQTSAFLQAGADHPAEANRDLLWALLTSAEFLTMP